MPYHFSLEAVLRLRRSQERVEHLKLEAIVSEQARTRALLDRASGNFLESRRLLRQNLAGTMCGSELQYEFQREERVAAGLRSLRGQLAELEQRRLLQLQRFLKSRQKREILESLRDRKLQVYRMEQSRREQQVLDDLFLMRHEILDEE